MADGARSEKSLARTLFLVFGGKTIGRSPLSSRMHVKVYYKLFLRDEFENLSAKNGQF